MDALAFLLSQPLYLALLMLLAGGGALAWPALSGEGRGDLKRRLRVEDPAMPAGDAARPASSALRQRAEQPAARGADRFAVSIYQGGVVEPCSRNHRRCLGAVRVHEMNVVSRVLRRDMAQEARGYDLFRLLSRKMVRPKS
jgi:hypothetical protein